jgi:uncharacterized protein YukE
MIVLQAVAGQMLFFHPLTWFLLPEIDRERENCCDDFVMKMNNNPINYIKALTMIQEMNLNSAVPVNALTGKSHHLLSRIKRLVKPEMKHSATFRMTVVLLFFATIGISAMTLLITGKPVNYLNDGKIMATIQQAGNLQNDDSGIILNGTANVTTDDKKNGQKKKMKIVFVNDTIKEMTVNGKAVKKSEMKEYEDEIRKIQQEMESSQQELEKVHRQLKEAQEELETAREELKDIAEEPDLEELSEFNKQFRYPHLQEYFLQPPNIILHDSLLNHYFNKENFKNILQNEEFQQEMKKAQEEVRKAAEEMRLKHEQYWRTHKDELWKEMKKAQEEARRSMEEMRKHREFYFQQDHPFMLEPSPAVPPVPEFELRELPEPKEIMPEKPENPDVMAPESPAEPDQKKTESLDSKLRELEEETIDL